MENLRNTHLPQQPLLSQEEKNKAFKRAQDKIAQTNINDHAIPQRNIMKKYHSNKFYVNVDVWPLLENNVSGDEIIDKIYKK